MLFAVAVSTLRSSRTFRLVTIAAGVLGVLLVGLSVTLLAVGFSVVRVEGQAMSPTLRDQDRVIVNKLVYAFNDPEIDDLVMLRYPRDPNKLFLKRVIARQGDRVEIVRGTVFRNGVAVEDSRVLPAARSAENWGPATVPERHYFVLGDRRNNSSDSRHWGYVPRGYILGRVRRRWFPEFSRVR